MKKEKGKQANYINHRGRFVSLRTRTKENGVRNYNAKILNVSPCYITFYDVKGKQVVKVAKSSVI